MVLGEKATPARGAATARPSAAGTESATRVVDVLMQFTHGAPSLGVSAIARNLGISKAVVHRILRSLALRSFVVLEPRTRTYQLGPAAVALGARALRATDLRRTAGPVLRELRDATNETTTLSSLVQYWRVYLDQYVSPQEINMTVELGKPYPLHAGASSRVILANLPEDQRRDAVATGLLRLTPATVVDADELERGLRQIQANGYAISHGERQAGAASVAAPIFGIDGQVIGSISVSGPDARFDDERVRQYIPLVLEASLTISRSLGWSSDDG